MNFKKYYTYKFKGIAYSKDPKITDSWKNEDKSFDITLAAQNLEGALILIREYIKNVSVGKEQHGFEETKAEFCEIEKIECGNHFWISL